jgi:predicted amidohydrolase
MTSQPDLEKNLVEAEELIELAVRQGAELVSLPENFPSLVKKKTKLLKQRRSLTRVKNSSKRWHSAFR